MNFLKSISLVAIFCISINLSAEELGAWYDDVGSPTFFDATFKIQNDNGKYYIHRISGDGSRGKYKAEKSGNKFIKINDKFGAYYVITDNGLTINDKNGYIRTAKLIK